LNKINLSMENYPSSFALSTNQQDSPLFKSKVESLDKTAESSSPSEGLHYLYKRTRMQAELDKA